jgi:hypothetical protein
MKFRQNYKVRLLPPGPWPIGPLAAADMAARPAALMRRFLSGPHVVPADAFAFAQRIFRALARALISLRRCAADRRRFARFGGSGGLGWWLAASTLDSPAMASSCPSNDSICSLSAMTRRRSATERSESDFIEEKDACGFSWESNTGFADSAFSKSRQIRVTSAPIGPACSGRSRWWERGGSFRHVGFVGFMSGFPASGL